MAAGPTDRAKIYQDRYIGEEIVAAGTRDCEIRYEAVATALAERDRPPTVLDVGANQGYFAFRLAGELGAVCVMVEKQPDLLRNCIDHGRDGLILLQRRITVRELLWLSGAEHFDVVLCLNVLHHFGWRWRRAARAIFDLGEDVFVENPPNDDSGSRGRLVRGPINRYLDSIEHTVVCSSDRRRDRPIVSAVRRYASHRAAGTPRPRTGIGLGTFARLGGSYPLHSDIRSLVTELQSGVSYPLAIDDIVVCGRRLELRHDRDPDPDGDRAGVGALASFLAAA